MTRSRTARLGIPALIAFAAVALMGADGDAPVTFASLLTPPGVIAAAAIITGLIQLLKGVFPGLDARVSGALMAFVGSAVLYVLAAAATGVGTPDAGLTVFLAWLSCATSSVGIKSVSDHIGTSS